MQPGRTQLQDWMDRRGFNQRETARELGMDYTTLNQILTGRRSVGLAIAVRIEQHTGIPVESWIRRTIYPRDDGTRA